MHVFDPNFFQSPKRYFIQSLLAALSIFLVTELLSFANLVIIASLASTAYIMFSLPSAATVRFRNVLGGHVIGVLVGVLFFWLRDGADISHPPIYYGLSVGLAFFLMVVTDTDHPPAAGTAMGFAASEEIVLENAIAVVLCVLVLWAFYKLLQRRLIDLRDRMVTQAGPPTDSGCGK
jgi:CBS-domain-containing membrane protein